MSVHRVTEQLCGKPDVMVPVGNGDKHLEEPFCVLSLASHSGQERAETPNED